MNFWGEVPAYESRGLGPCYTENTVMVNFVDRPAFAETIFVTVHGLQLSVHG